MPALDVLVRLDLQVIVVDALEAILAVTDFCAILSRDRAGVHVDSRDLAVHNHYAHPFGDSRTDGGEYEIAAWIHRRVLIEQTHVHGLVERHADLNLSESVFAESKIAHSIMRSSLTAGSPGELLVFDPGSRS